MKNVSLKYFEYDRVKFNQPVLSGGYTFTAAQISALLIFHTTSNGLYYDLIDNGIRFKEHVGVIQINELTIEVLPKVDKEDNELGKWQAILIDMLKECYFISPQSTGYAKLNLRSNSILKLYFEKYLIELETLLHQGLIKKYRTEEGNQNSLKGRLMFDQHIQKNLIHAERFYTKHLVYDQNHYIHQILLQALTIVNKLSPQSELTERINTILIQWPQGKTIVIDDALFKTIPNNRKTQSYKEALLIAKMLLLNYHPDLRGGKESVLALMFNMNELWEEFVFRRLKSMEREFNWKVTSQKGVNYWTGDTGSKKLIPDIVIHFADTSQKIILDTKWKRPSKNKPDDNDLRQLLSYKLYFQGDTSYLLYPCCGVESHTVEGYYHNKSHQNNSIFKDTFGLHGGLLFLNMVSDKKLISKVDFKTIIKKNLYSPLAASLIQRQSATTPL
jgi:5-methylcytosine-specific restriction enzyme subunit McrC